MESKHDAPADDVGRQVLGHRDALDDPVRRVFDYQDRDIDNCCEPTVLYTSVSDLLGG